MSKDNRVYKPSSQTLRRCDDCKETIECQPYYVLVEGKKRKFWHKSCVYSFIIEGKGNYRW